MSQLNGIDISFAQGQIDLGRILNQWGAQFVIIRAGYGGSTAPDGQFIRNRDQARALKVPRQFYWFAYPGRSSGAAQAKAFHAIVGSLQPGESLSLDMEDEASYGRRLVASDVAWAKEFLDTCKTLFGVKPLIYMNTNVLGRYDWTPISKADYGLWLANYGLNDGVPHTPPNPAPWPFWAIWQYSSNPIDKDKFNGDVATFLKYGKSGSTPAPSPAPKPAPAPAPKPTVRTYTVQKGDTLYKIAAKFHTTYQKLASLNGIKDPDKIYPGQVLKISSTVAAPVQHRTYTVRKGDTLTSIAAKYHTTWQHLASLNRLSNPDRIVEGQVLKIS